MAGTRIELALPAYETSEFTRTLTRDNACHVLGTRQAKSGNLKTHKLKLSYFEK